MRHELMNEPGIDWTGQMHYNGVFASTVGPLQGSSAASAGTHVPAAEVRRMCEDGEGMEWRERVASGPNCDA
ncbi:hypothetical protein TYRP_000158 [Tyrophagus putrescentiae]|nr:hypothetical protein TYRP_000158 [Tyrophagus putrescentiae]